MRLLPPDRDVAWIPYVWLVYLLNLAIYPLVRHASAGEWAWTLLSIALFLPLYFRGYWEQGTRLLSIAGAITVLGVVWAPYNPGASVYFVFAGCFVPKAAEPRQSVPYLGGLVAIIGIESWVLHLPVQFWAPGAFFTVVMGAVTTHYEQRRRANAKLRLAQEEVEHLAKVAERERIGRDLHDLLGHTLSVIVLKSELAARLAEKDPARAAAEIRDVEQISRDALAQVRAAVRGYRSAGIDAELLDARRALEAAGVQVAAEIEPGALPPAQEGVLALALREAITNVARHAHATACKVSLRRDGRFCELTVADNGRGGAAAEGCGLGGMRQRVEALGGTLERDGGSGTRLRVRLPLGGEA
jgi:two-component system, NarL family, sensor histidine kinase DesK